MILDVCQCSQLFFDVFSWVVTFMDNHPLCGHFFLRMPSIDHRYSIEILRCVQDVLRCSQIFPDDQRCFWIFSRNPKTPKPQKIDIFLIMLYFECF